MGNFRSRPGLRPLGCLVPSGLQWRAHRALALRHPTLRQRALDLVILRAASRRAVAGRDRRPMAAHRGNHHRVLLSTAARCTVAGALSRVGKLRIRAYLVFVAVESCGSWLAAMLWPNPSIEKALPGEPGEVSHLKR
jgi:hypothetical protein